MTIRRIRFLFATGAALLALAWVSCGAAGTEESAPGGAEAANGAVEETDSREPTAARMATTNPIDVEGSASLGPAGAPVTLVEFSDFQ